MVISFLCPNGHKLKCPSAKAGQEGKCPKCGTRFQVPMPGAADDADSSAMISLPENATSDDIQAAGGAGAGSFGNFMSELQTGEGFAPPAPSDTIHSDTIVFLCPNGHKLNAPASLQGKPGKCPHCAERFLVPEIEDDASGSGNYVDLNQPPESVPSDSSKFATPAIPPTLDFGSDDQFSDGTDQSNAEAMANLITRLWNQRGENGNLDLYLRGGEVISPHWFAPEISRPSFGLFAFREADGTVTITAIQWEAIERVALRGLSQLPSNAFQN